MRRWNGWGDETVTYHLPGSAIAYLEKLIGPGRRPKDVSLGEILSNVPPSRLFSHPLLSLEVEDRLRHARGQSLPDWICLRAGIVPVFPDAVAHPVSRDDVRELMRLAWETGAQLIPYGGGTSVAGHINPMPGEGPVLTVDMHRMNALVRFDESDRVATFGAGVAGPDLEAGLRARGYTLGHFPQSFEFSTLGGWVATRSCGQQSLGYGRMQTLFKGGNLEAPSGSIEMPIFPASSAGPELKEMILGSEGRLGILTEVTVHIRPVPMKEDFHAVFFPDFETGRNGVRQLVQAGLPFSMLRLSTAEETDTTLRLAGHENLIKSMEWLLSIRGLGKEKCMLLIGFCGPAARVSLAKEEAFALTRRHKGVHLGRSLGKAWQRNRFLTPYLRNTLWEMGYAVDTLETAVGWRRVASTLEAVETALRSGLKEVNERVHVMSHLSHPYPDGSSIYTTYLFRIAPDPEETMKRWQILKGSASRAIVDHGGTISHQHGVGRDHMPYLKAEKGRIGLEAIRRVSQAYDPEGIMNPGKLIP